MHTPVLVVTPTSGFGALIQQTLEESGLYQVVLTSNPRDALSQANLTPFRLCILDLSDAGEEGAVDAGERNLPSVGSDPAMFLLATRLRERLPALRVVIVPPDNNPENPIVEAFRADGTLTKPFYLPDLLDTLDEVMRLIPAGSGVDRFYGPLGKRMPAPEIEESLNRSEPPVPGSVQPEALTWLEDVNRAARHLARLSLEAAAQAALIVSQGELWAYAGELSLPAVQELSQAVALHWSRGGSSDLARFVRLETIQSEFMLYATRLGGEMVLALVFDAETPFSKIRSQASRLARALSSPLSKEESELQALNGNSRSISSLSQEDVTARERAPLPPLYDDVPPPSPLGWGSVSYTSSWHSQAQQPERVVNGVEEEDFPVPAAVPDPLADTRPSLVRSSSPDSPSGSEEPVAASTADPLGSDDVDELQPASGAVCNLYYACMLIPRLPQHHLAGEMTAHLPEWVSQLSLAFGWRLEHLSLRPDYLLWIVKVMPTVSPSFLVRLMRKHTSQRIFARFPDFAQENPSGDFWAPGYLVMSSSQPPPVAVMQDFIQQTRKRQGAA